MKRIIYMFFMLFCLSCMMGCSNNRENPAVLHDAPVSDDILVEIKEESLSNTGFELVVKNQSADYIFSWGNHGQYIIEKYDKGKWKEITQISGIKEDYGVAYKLDSQKSTEYKEYWGDKYGELLKGKYRYIKMVEKSQLSGASQEVCFVIEFSV